MLASTRNRPEIALHRTAGTVFRWIRSAAAGRHLIAIAVMVSACSPAVIVERDGAPRGTIDIASIADAVPRQEPLSRYGNPDSYEVRGRTYRVMKSSSGYVERGVASWYGTKFHNRRTSSGEPYDMYAMTAAHTSLPLPTYVRVTNLDNGRSVIVKVNDRGPFEKGRLIDLSYVAAQKLGIIEKGTGFVEVRALDTRDPVVRPVRAASSPDDEHGGVYLQVGAFVTHFRAEQLLARVNRVLPVGGHISEAVTDRQVLYRVRVGPIGSPAEADRIASLLLESGIEMSKIVTD